MCLYASTCYFHNYDYFYLYLAALKMSSKNITFPSFVCIHMDMLVYVLECMQMCVVMYACMCMCTWKSGASLRYHNFS